MSSFVPSVPLIESKDPAIQEIMRYLVKLTTSIEYNQEIQALGVSKLSPLLKATIPATSTTPSIPANPRSVGLYKQIFIVWDFDPNPAIGGWEISRSPTSGGTYVVIGFARTNCFTDDLDVQDSQDYFYKIKSVLLNGSTFSAFSAVTTAEALPNDTGVITAVQSAAKLLNTAMLQNQSVSKSAVYTNADYTLSGSVEQVIGSITLDTYTNCNVLLLAKGKDDGLLASETLRIRVGNSVGGTLIDVSDGNFIKCFGVDQAPGTPTQQYCVTVNGISTDHMTDIALIGLVLNR